MDTTNWSGAYPPAGPGVPENAANTPPPAGVPWPPTDPDYPFEEPETAPELRQQRSESLYTRTEPFWDRVIELPREGEEYPQDPEYWNHPEEVREGVMMRVGPDRPLNILKKALGARITWYVAGIAAVLAAVIFLLYSTFGTVHGISVEGNTTIPDDEIIALSQLEIGMSIFDVDEEAVMERIARNRYLRCTLVDVVGDRVVLHVSERVPVCSIRHNGRLITLDNRGWVLEVADDTGEYAPGLIRLTGLDIRHWALGQAVTTRQENALTVYTQLLVELKALGALDMITELDMTSMDSLTLKTDDGFNIQLGNENRIHAKIRAMLVVHEVVLENRYYGEVMGGTIVVSDPANPAYRKPEAE